MLLKKSFTSGQIYYILQNAKVASDHLAVAKAPLDWICSIGLQSL